MLTPEAALQILKDLYESEIDWSICTWWDGGYFATLGQSADLIEAGAKPQRLEGEIIARSFDSEFSGLTFEEVVEWLRDAAIRMHPETAFAQKYWRIQ